MSWLAVDMIIHYNQRQLHEKIVYLAYGLQSIIERSKGINSTQESWGRNWSRPCRNAASWLAPNPNFSYILYRSQAHLPRHSTPRSWLGYSESINNKENSPLACQQDNTMGDIFSCGSLLSDVATELSSSLLNQPKYMPTEE